ncbi:MAG: M56 family metallopeptidase, partial [Planctomycetota bacterium]
MNTIVEHINSTGHAFVEFALPMLIQSSVLIVILLLLDLLLRKKVKAVFRYWIWMLVLIKLILPTSLSSPLSLGYLFGEKLTYQDLAQSSPRLEPTVPAPAEISSGVGSIYIQPNPYIPPAEPVVSVTEPVIAETISPPQVPVTPLTWQGVVFLVWLTVVIAMGLLLLQRALFVRGLVAQAKKAGRLMNDALAFCCAGMGIKSKVGLKVSVNATTPSVCGLIRPVILVPWKLTSTLGASRLRTILMHELAHIKRGDLWVNLAQTALQIIYFYNPLLWLANFVIRRIREQAVDEAVLVAMGEKAQKYPQTLVDVAKMAFKRPALGLRLIGVVESKSALAGRIKHILGRPMPKSARLGIVSVFSILITAGVLLPMARARESAFAGQGGPLNIRLAGVRPDGSDVIYDGNGNKIAENTFANIANEWGEDQQHRTFIFELPKTEEPILFPPFLKIKPAGEKRVFGTAQHPFLYYSDGKLRYSVYTSLPRTYKKVFERQVKKVDLTLPYYYGQRGAADFVFTGPFTAGQTVKAEGDADCELTPKEDKLDFSHHPTAFFRISSKTRFDGDSVLIYDTSGRRYFLETAYVTVGEKPYEATFKNVVVSYPDRPVLERLEFLDEMCERLDLTGFSGDRLLNNYTFENPADAIRVIDIVRGYQYVMKVFRAIRYSDSGIEISNLDSQAQQKVRSAAARWAKAGHPRVREMGIRLGLVGGWPEFMDLALDWLEKDVIVYDMLGRAYRGLEKEAKEQIAVEVASYPIALNSEQAERLKKIILSKDSPRLGMRLFRIFWRADEDLIFHTCWDLAQDDRPWIWWPAMYSLSNRGNKKLRPFENLPEKIQKRLILVHKAGGSSRLFDVSSSGKDYETVVKEAYAMLPAMFTARLARMNGRTCNDVRQVMAKHLDREIAAKAMADFLREISTESNQRLWVGDSYYFGTCCSTAYYVARHINSLYDVNIDNLGKYETRENSEAIPRNISQLIQLIADTLQWYDGRSGAGNESGIAAEIGMADRVEAQVGPLDHFVGRYALAARPDTTAFEITKEGDVFIFRDLGGPKFEMDILLRGLKGHKFEMEKGRDNLKFGRSRRDRFRVRYEVDEDRYILDSLGMRGEVQDSMISPLTDLVKISEEKPWDYDVPVVIEETISPKLVMLLILVNSCAPETDLNIESVSITARNIEIKGDTSNRANTLKFFDAVNKSELEVLQFSFVARDNRDKFRIAVEPKKNLQNWLRSLRQNKPDIQGVEENISPKLLMLLGAIADCAAETELSIQSVSMTTAKIEIKGSTSSTTNTLKFLDALKKNELQVMLQSYVTRDNRNKFSMVAEPKENWRQWWRKHKTDIKADIPAKEDVVSKPPHLERLLVKPPIVAYDVKLNFADPTARDGSFHSEQSVAFSLSFHNIEIGPAEKFTLGHLLIGQTTWPVHLEENGIAIHEGVTGQKIKSLKWPSGEPRFDKVIKIHVKYGNREYSCPVRVDLDRYNKDAPTGAYWFCAYLSGRLPWGAGGSRFEIVNLDQQMEFRLTGDGTDPRDAVLGIDINGDGKIDSAKEGGEQFDLYEPFQIGSKTYQLAEVDPYLPRVVFRELDARMLPHPLTKADVPVEEGKGSSEIAEGTPIYKKTIRFTGVVTKIMEFNPSGNHETFAVEDDPRFILFLQVTAADPQNYWFQPGSDVDFLIHDPVVLFGPEQKEVVGKSYYFVMGEDVKRRFRLLSVKPLAAKPKTDVPVEFKGPGEENQVIWGKPRQGVQVGVNVEKEKWRIGGDVPRLNVEVRISDPKKFEESGLAETMMAHSWSVFALEIDGKRYKQNVFTTTEPVQLQSPFKIPLFLDDEWQGGPGLNPGRHKIRVLFVGLGMRLPSGPVEIEVLPDDRKPEPWPYPWGKAVAGVQVSAHPAQPSWPVGSEPVIRVCMRNQSSMKWWIHEAPSSFALEVDGKRYENNFIFHVWRLPFAPGDVHQFDLKLSKSKPFHDGLRKGNTWPPVGKSPPLLPGKHTVRVLFTELRIEPEPASLPVEFEIVPAGSDVHVEAEPGGATSGLVWGKKVNGLRAAVEFVPQKKSYSLGERVGIRFHVQNVSAEPIQFISDTWRQNDRATIEDEDGKRQPVSTAWYSDWTAVDRYYLKPGEKAVVESSDFAIVANNEQADDLGYPVGYTLVCVPGTYSVGFSVRIPNASTSSLPPQADDWKGVLQTGKHRLVVTAASGPDQLTVVPVEVEKPVDGKWEDVGEPIPADFNDTIALTEQITLSSIGQDVEGKTFITFVWDKEKNRNRQYRFVLINKKGTVFEPDSHLILDEKGRLKEKFTFDEPYVSWRLKEFKFQNRPLLPAVNRTISSKLQKGTSTAFEGKAISPSGLAPPGRYTIELDGVNDYLFVPDSPTLRLKPPFTVEMWIKPKLPEQMPDRMQEWGVIAQGGYIGTGRVKPRGFGIQLTRFEKEPATFNVSYQEANDKGLFGKDFGSYRFDEWMHISHIFDGGNYKPSHGHPLVIGRFLIPMPEPFMGQIGEVRIWNSARTREEIRRYKNRALTGKEPDLAACWTFEQAEGQFAYDISGNNNHARFGKAIEPDDADPKWVDLEAPVHQPGRIAHVPIEVEGIAKDEIGRLREVGERRTIPERRKGRIEFFGLDLTDAPHTTKLADLPDLFEERPPDSKSYEIAGGVTVIYGGFEGTVYYIPEKEVFYIQQDKLGSSTLTYYGPFNGDPHQVLDRQIDVSIKAEEAKANSGANESPANEAGPRIKFESLVCDLGLIAPNTKYVCEFKYTNTGNEVLKITRVGVACACTTPQKTRVCEPGESGTLKVTYQSGASAGKVRKNVYVHSNDKVNPRITLTIKAEIVVKVAHEPKRLNLVLDKEDAGCPAVTLTSLDNQPFSITGFESTGGSITADFDSSLKRTSFVIRPKVDMEKLRKGMRGQINVSLDHPECKRITVSFETLTKFKVDPRIVYVREAEPQKPITKTVRILSNYNEDFEIESTSAKNSIIRVLAQEKIRDGYQ